MDSGPLIPANAQALREIQPTYPIELNRQPGIYPPLPTQDSVLREYLRVLIKRKWVVVSSLGLIFAVVAIATLRSTPVYDAVGSIAINKTEPSLLNFKESGGGGAEYYDPTDLDTEVRILRSDMLALGVIRELNLDKHNDSSTGQEAATTLALTTDTTQLDSAKLLGRLESFKGNLRVALVPNTRIIEIHYRSPDKNLAANAVNTLTKTYVEQNIKTRFDATMQASEWLSNQLVDLKMKVETSQEKLVKYQKEHEILGTDEKQNIITAKLDELNKELTSAESSRMEKESVYRLVQSNDPDTAAAAATNVEIGTTGTESSSSLLEKLRAQQADLKIQIAQLSTQFGPSYPKVTQMSTQLKEVEAQTQSEIKKVVSRVRNDYLASQQRENMLHDALEKQKQEANRLNESAIEYSILKRDLDTNRALYEGLLEKLKEAEVAAGLKSSNFRIVDIARVPTEPAEPNIPRNLSFALMLGLTTGIGLAFLLEGIDNTVRTPEQAQAISALPSLGMIPLGSKSAEGNSGQRLSIAASKEAVELVTQARPQSQMAESYRALRTSLLLTSLGAPPKVILITSALPQEGKTTTSINCAIVLAQKGTRVLLMDADLRRPSIHKTFGLGPRTGLSNVLTGSATLQQAIIRSTLLPTLFLLPAGTPPPNPAELLASTNMKDVLEELRGQYDHIVMDTPPTLSVTDAVVMSTRADAVVLVIRSGQTTKQALRRARELLTQVNARVSGVLLNAVDLHSPDYYYYYEYQGKYGQRYYQEDELTGEDESVPQANSSSA
jgi:exopolysaccharide transport family protein